MPRSTQLPLSHEKRRHTRLDTNIPLKISSDNGDILTETKNISCSGAFFRVSQRLEPMTKLRIYLLLPIPKNDKVITKKIICQGVIVRSQIAEDSHSYDIAVFFSDIAPKDSRTINDFIEGMLESRKAVGPQGG